MSKLHGAVGLPATRLGCHLPPLLCERLEPGKVNATFGPWGPRLWSAWMQTIGFLDARQGLPTIVHGSPGETNPWTPPPKGPGGPRMALAQSVGLLFLIPWPMHRRSVSSIVALCSHLGKGHGRFSMDLTVTATLHIPCLCEPCIAVAHYINRDGLIPHPQNQLPPLPHSCCYIHRRDVRPNPPRVTGSLGRHSSICSARIPSQSYDSV